MQILLKTPDEFDFEHTYVRLHGNFVAYYAVNLCAFLELNPYRIGIAAFYHDFGKYKWSSNLFVKKELDVNDWLLIKRHPIDGVQLLFDSSFINKDEFIEGDPSIADYIYMHHERPDGKGYYGIRDIPVESAILSISDIFDATLSDRPYRKHLSIEMSLKSALEPYAAFLNKKGYNDKDIMEYLKKLAIQFTFKPINVEHIDDE